MASFTEEKVYDAVIVGSGLGGLQTARDLIDNHNIKPEDILILEAQDYIGGRVRQNTEWIPGVKVEFGAEILHGRNTVLTRWAKEHNEPMAEIFCWAHGDGGPDEANVHGNYGLYYMGNGKDKSRLLRFDDEDEDFVKVNETLWDFHDTHEDNFDENTSILDYLKAKNFSEEMLLLANAGFANTFCSNLGALSLKQSIRWCRLWNGRPEDDGDGKLVNSYGVLIDYLKKDLNVVLNTPVNKVQIVETPDNANAKTVVVETATGAKYQGKTCIVNATPNALKSGYINFQPALPQDKVDALSYVDMRSACKVFIKFSKVCWPKHVQGIIMGDPSFMFPEIWFRDVTSLVQEGDQTAGYATAFCTAEFADRIIASDPEEVYAKMVEQLDTVFSKLEPRHFSVALGEEAEESNSKESRFEDEQECIAELEQLPKPSEVYISGNMQCWDKKFNPFIAGGFVAPKVNCPINSSAILATPIDNVLYFVGEGANPGACSTAHAAVESGMHIAKLVSKHLAGSQ